MKKKKKETSLKTRIIFASMVMIVIPIILTMVAFMGIKTYFQTTLGEQSFQAKVDPQILEMFMIDIFVTFMVILLIAVLILNQYTKNVLACDIHTRARTKRILKAEGATVYGLDDVLSASVNGSGYNPDYGLLGSNKYDTVYILFYGNIFCN